MIYAIVWINVAEEGVKREGHDIVVLVERFVGLSADESEFR